MPIKNLPFKKFFLISIILFGFILRIYNLSYSPPGFNADEAALGYNAYSIIQTGKDEWGKVLPLVFKSFSDYKPALYSYLDIPFIYVLGLTELATRLPSILLGSLSIFLIYLLSKEIFKKELFALTAALLLAISPWHIHYSRGAWETNVATFFILLGVWLFIKGYDKSWKWLAGASISFAASAYTYQSARLTAPLFVLLIILFYWKKLWKIDNLKALAAIFIFATPFIYLILTSQFLSRFEGISIFADVGPVNRLNQERGEDQNPDSFSAKFYHNKISAYSIVFLSHYLEHFNPEFLFISGDPLKRNKVPDMGEMYIFEIITLITGIYILIKNKYKDVKVLFLWLISAPAAAALTYQTPHALRALALVMPLTIISGLGLGSIIEKIKEFKKIFRNFSILFVGLVIFLSVIFYLHQYYVHLPKEYALEWQYGFSQAMSFVIDNQNKYQKIIITDRYDQPYILLLFYSKYDPAKYQNLTKKEGDNKFGFTTVTAFDKFEFRPISQEEVLSSHGILFVGTGEEIKEGNIIKEINFPSGMPAFRIVGT